MTAFTYCDILDKHFVCTYPHWLQGACCCCYQPVQRQSSTLGQRLNAAPQLVHLSRRLLLASSCPPHSSGHLDGSNLDANNRCCRLPAAGLPAHLLCAMSSMAQRSARAYSVSWDGKYRPTPRSRLSGSPVL